MIITYKEDNMKDLIAILEAEPFGNRKLDQAIAIKIGFPFDDQYPWAFPAFTTSVDAAFKWLVYPLKERYLSISEGLDRKWVAQLRTAEFRSPYYENKDRKLSPAHALCIGALKAQETG